MKKLLALLLLCIPAFGTTTFTGHIGTLGTTSVTTGSFVRFWLRGCGGNQPRVGGLTIIAPSQGAVFFFDFRANSSGDVTGTLYSNRDVTGLTDGEIECGGSHTSTWYGMQVFYAGKGGPEIPMLAKSTDTFDISNVTPLSTAPVVTAPDGDSTYLRLDAGNGPITGPLTFNGAVTLNNSNGVIYVDGLKYPTLASAIAAASAGDTVIVPPGTYTQALGSITISAPIHLTCANPTTTFLSFSGASGIGLLVNYDSGSGGGSMNDIGATIENCTLIGPGGLTGASGDAGTGLQLGDATHASVGFRLINTQLHGFATGISWGNSNAWGFEAQGGAFVGNTQDVLYSFTSGIGCALCKFSGTAFEGAQSSTAIQIAGTVGGHFIFSACFFGDRPISMSAAGGFLELHNNDFENTVNTSNYYITQSAGLVKLSGLNLFQQTQASGTVPPALVHITGGTLSTDPFYASSASTMSALVAISGSANLDLNVLTDTGFTNNYSGTTTGAIAMQTQAASFFGRTFAANVDYTEGGAFANGGLAGADRVVGDSVTHMLLGSYNNSSFHKLPLFEDGTCTMAAATTCTFAITGFTSAPFCDAFLDAAATPPATAISAKCSASGNTVTITAGASNSLAWDALLIGNPN